MDQTLQGPTGGALTEPVAVSDRLPELRGMFERILCVARSSDQKPIGNIELADRLIKAVVSWGASGAALAQPEPEAEGPTDQELADAFAEGCRDGSKADEPPFLGGARAVLARWGRAGLADGPAVPEGREPAAVTVEPSDGDLLQLMPEQFRADLGTVSRMAAHGAGPDIKPGLFRVSLNTGALEYARAVLARWGHQPAPPAEGEVAELVSLLRAEASDDEIEDHLLRMTSADARRAADLLERLASPACLALKPSPELTEAFKDLPPGRIELLPEDAKVIEPAEHTILVPAPMPVAVSERLPGPGDCNEDGECWAWRGFDPDVDDDGEFWQLTLVEWLDEASCWTHWLPAHALPLPAGEVEE